MTFGPAGVTGSGRLGLPPGAHLEFAGADGPVAEFHETGDKMVRGSRLASSLGSLLPEGRGLGAHHSLSNFGEC